MCRGNHSLHVLKHRSMSLRKKFPWISIGRTDAEVEAPVLRPPDAKSQLTGKDPFIGKDWRQEKGEAEGDMVRQHHWFNGHEFEQTLGDSEGQGAWCAAVHGVANSQTWLSDWTTTTEDIDLRVKESLHQNKLASPFFSPKTGGQGCSVDICRSEESKFDLSHWIRTKISHLKPQMKAGMPEQRIIIVKAHLPSFPVGTHP